MAVDLEGAAVVAGEQRTMVGTVRSIDGNVLTLVTLAGQVIRVDARQTLKTSRLVLQAALEDEAATRSAADSARQVTSAKGAANGYCGLDAGAKVAIGNIPTGTTGTTVAIGNHNHSGVYDPAGTAAAAVAAEAASREAADLALAGDIADGDALAQQLTGKDAASGYCGLDANSLIAHGRLQIATRILRVLPIGMGTTGWSTITTGTPGTFYTNSPQYDSDQRVATIFQAHVVDVGSTTTGTNAICAYQNAGAIHYLSADARIVWHGLLVNAGNIASARVMFIANGASAAATGRPAYGVWLEYDPTTLGNSNWWACCANGGSVSTADTGVAANNTERVWLIEFESTTSCKVWELVTSTSSARATLTSQLPSGTTAQTGRLALQAQRITGGSGNGKLMTINGDFGLVLPSYGIDKAWPA